MTFWDRLAASVQRRDSLLCVGLDPDPQCLPSRFADRRKGILAGLGAWNRHVIEATMPWACAYKPNLAFYLWHGPAGLELLQDTMAAIPPEVPVILDGKFGDLASSAQGYAVLAFAELGVDAVTVNPYLGQDALEPFLTWADKGCFVLCHTSNPGAQSLQQRDLEGAPLYMQVAADVQTWHARPGLVVGATYPRVLQRVRAAVGDCWLLVPGVGRQGGDLDRVLQAGLFRREYPSLIVNVSSSLATAPDPAAMAASLVQRMRAGMVTGAQA